MSKGILMFAHNNSEIDYLRMAYVNAKLIKKHLGVNVGVVTDKHSYDFVSETISVTDLHDAIDHFVFTDKDRNFKVGNKKVYRDTVNTAKTLSFYNINRADAYNLSPWDETIMIDTDYIILGDTLNQCWGHKNPLMMNYTWQDINFNRSFDLNRVANDSITMYWATVVYFQKDPLAENFFNMVKHVRDNNHFYKTAYRWPGKTFRNDYAFSIAAHIINGLHHKHIPELPFKLYKTFDLDDIHSVKSASEIVMYLEKHDAQGEYIMSNWHDLDLHVMNKWALNRATEDLLWHANHE